jgi:AAA domain, putative AbiEii toxin, Type IV TA system/TIR domain/AAA domain
MSTPDRNSIFVSYSHEDRRWLDEIRVHLTPILRSSTVQLWTDDQAKPGGDWDKELRETLSRTRLGILLVSPAFLASDFIYQVELPLLLKAAEKGELALLWIPVRPSLYKESVIARYRAAWDPDRPLNSLNEAERDRALTDIARVIAGVLREGSPADESAAYAADAPTKAPALLVQKIHLRGIRCFEDITLDLSAQGKPSLRTVILGDNATGKTTLLRSIALGLCDESGATALLKKVPGPFLRDDTTADGVIELELVREGSGETFSIRTEVQRKSGSEVIRKTEPPGFSPAEIFIAGYGTERTKQGIVSYDRYSAAEAVTTLFDYNSPLQNPELVLRRQPVWLREQIGRKLVAILLLDQEEGELSYSEEGIDVSGPWGKKPLEVLSDGYRSTTQWILDFISWLVYARRVTDPEDLTGIVLIDELEQHLHPQWQREIISRLREHLPRVQFIVTSHSPLIAASIGTLGAEASREQLIHLTRNGKGRVVAQKPPLLKGLTTDQVLASSAFDYLIQADPEVEKVLAEASRLASKGSQRTGEEEERYDRVKEIIAEILPEEGDTEVEREVRQDLHQKMKTRVRELEAAVFGEAR